MKYAKDIIQVRAALNLTQEQLGELLGVSFSTVNRWENGKTVPSKRHLCILENICRSNNIEVEVFSHE